MNKIKPAKPGRNNFSRTKKTTSVNRNKNNVRGKRISTLDPELLINKSVIPAEISSYQALSFEDLPLNSRLKLNLVNKGFSHPTQIQIDTLEHLLNGRDLVGIARTGTGKTAAFLIPLIEHMIKTRLDNYALVIVPTRELALQVEEEFESLTKGMDLFASSFIGGTNLNEDFKKLKRKSHLIIGTPGRMLDLIKRKALHLDKISTLVLDEFDRMLDMGFVNDINYIVDLMHQRKQTILFSATKDKTQNNLIKDLLFDPVEVQTQSALTSNNQIEQDVIRVPHGEDKFNHLLSLIGAKEFEKVLIFAETKRMVDRISKKLNRAGVGSDQIHGNKSQNYRNRALSKFKNGQVKVLIATDVAARGIDVADITHVINYQLPMTLETYIHRIGRTGRAGKVGKAFTFVD